MTPGIKLDIETESGTVLRCEGVLSDPSRFNNFTRGERATIEVLGRGEQEKELIVVGSETIPAGETRTVLATRVLGSGTLTVDGTLNTGRLSVAQGGTLDNNGTVTVTDLGGVMELLQFEPFAGSFATVETLSSSVYFKERLPATSGDDPTSLLVGIEPGDDLKREDIRGVWGLIQSVTDTRDPTLEQERAEIELLVLARKSEYQDHAAVRNDLEVTL